MDSEIRGRFSEIQKSIKWPVYLFDYQGKCIDANNHEKIGEKVDVPDIPNGNIVTTGKFQWISVGSRMGVNTYYIALFGADEAATGAMNLIRIMFREEHKELDKNTVLRSLLFEQGSESYSADDLEEVGLTRADYLNVVIIDHKGAQSSEVKVVCENIIDEILVVEVDRNHVAMVVLDQAVIEETLEIVLSEMNTELLIPAKASVGKAVADWDMLYRSYKSAKSALVLGKKLGNEENVYYYDQMMIYHLIHEINEDARDRYFKDYGGVFKDLVHDEELIQTAIRFFENDLNITETSRQLYVHRNTLIYRLNKIEKLTALDLRSFDDAIQFFLLMLIWRLGDYEVE